MFRRVHHRLRSKRPSSEPHPQHAESQSGPPVQTTVSTETGVTKPQDAVGTIDLPGSSLSGANVPVDAEQSRDLWEEAFAKLDNDKKDLLSKIENPHGGKVVEQVAEQTEQIYREREERGWKISRSEGKSNINLRAAFKKILTSILKFKELISAGMACEPTGHAAAAWTIVSLGLQMVKNDADLRSNILETCGKLAENLALLAATETNYRRRTVPDSGSLEDAIVTVYVAILELSAAVVQENSLNMGRRIFRSFTALPEQPLHDFNDALESKKAKLKEWTDIIKREYQAQEAEDLDNKIGSTLCKIEELAQQVSNIATKIFSAEELSILDWLSKYDFSDSHSAATSRREDDTGAWILRLPEYKAWKVTDSSLLWLYGNSGCGKSILCSSIIDDFRNLRAPESTSAGHALAYWYFAFSDEDSINMENLLSSIIRQLCAQTQTMPKCVGVLWKEHRTAGSRPTKRSLVMTLDGVLVSLRIAGQHAFVVLDGLDEYPLLNEHSSSDRQQMWGRDDVLDCLEQILAMHPNVRILVLSRDETDIRSRMRKAMKVDVAKYLAGDLNIFIQKIIGRIVQGKPWKREYEAEMLSRFKDNSERRFRWSSLVLRRFADCKTHEIMQEALTNLPESLGAIYADVLANKIPKDYMEKARFILIWLYHSLTPLTLGEVARVTSLPEPRDVLDICTSSLVSLQRKKGSSHKLTDDYDDYDDYDDMEGLAIVQIDHFSVKEYLASEDMASSQEAAYFYLTPLVAHLTIAAMSVAYMIKNNEPKILARYDYASTWFKHIQMADAIDYNTPTSKEPRSKAQTTVSWSEVESLRVQIHRLFCKEHLQTFRNWALLCSPSTSEHGSSYHFVGRWEFAMALSNSPIAMTALLNLPDNMRRLLTSGARADGDYGDANISTTEITNPLQIAAIVGNLDIMKLLLESNARLETSELDVIASQNGRHGAAVLSTLLKAQPDLEISDKFVLRSANNPNSVDIFHYILGTSMLYNPTDEVLMLRTDKVLMRRPKANSVLRSAWNSGVSPRAPESIEYDSASFSDWF